METKQLNATLRSLLGHLVLDTPEDQKNLNRLGKSLSQSSLESACHSPIKTEFNFEKSDLFFENKIDSARKKIIADVSKNRIKKNNKTQYKVFRREAPIREHLLHNSIADWAVGAKVDHSIGPFKNKDGRQFWYDFFTIEKLIKLYMQGEAEPVLLFRVKQGKRLSTTSDSALRINPSKTYTLGKGSIWIRSKFLAPNAPVGGYTGLTINGGKLTLSIIPKTIGGKLTVSGNTKITVDLKLDQPEVTDADPTSPHGKDAREMVLRLPDALKFHFSGNGRTIDQVSNANWTLYGQKMLFKWKKGLQTNYDANLQRIVFGFEPSSPDLIIHQSESKFNRLSGQAPTNISGWVLPVAMIDISQPIAAEGIGQIFVICKDKGILSTWNGLKGGGLALSNPAFLVGPGQIFLIDFQAGNPHASQTLDLWKDELNPFGTKVKLSFSNQSSLMPFYYASNANGNELLMAFTNASFEIDRPVRVNGEPPVVRSLNSLLLVAVNKTTRLIYLLDDNLILDDAEINNEDPIIPDRMAFAITNALFKVLQPNGCLLFGSLSEDLQKVEKGFFFLTFGLLAYVPTLPDPYAANLGILNRQIRGKDANRPVGTGATAVSQQQFTAWLVCRIAWDVPSDESENDVVEVSFHFAPLNNPFAGISFEGPEEEESEQGNIGNLATSTADISASSSLGNLTQINSPASALGVLNVPDAVRGNTTASSARSVTNVAAPVNTTAAAFNPDLPNLPDYESSWDKETYRYRRDLFALLDVSTNADLFGISFDLLTQRDFRVSTGVNASGEATANFFPVQVDGMEVVSTGANVKAFTVPQVSWEPVFNLTPPSPVPGDPDWGFNYYPNDGGPSHILNNSREPVALAPLPVTEFLVKNREENEEFMAFSFFTLPFGIKAIASMEQTYGAGSESREGADINRDEITFENNVESGLQLRLDAGMPLREGDSKMFMGTTVQINNILNLFGGATGNSTLGASVTEIFNGEFFNPQPGPFNLLKDRGVPVTRMDMSGYGANMFSNWLNSKAALAETSQAKFDIFMGRCAHEVIQVKSIVYPWAIKVVRTITLFRVASGYTYRFDSGWRAESDGKFDFRYFVFVPNPANPPVPP
ncbi:hypothetical protein [Maribacter halichondriae]|uniref:hypothetical protein n=1 Tax=Maribacter halichondriae TaxID=2980554 RepID=UPI0023581968|nr:hypothetical protein [Maribacter sp. Hal144]